MVDIIIVLIVIVLLGFALKGSIKHFKGESPCCGGGGGEIVLDIPDKKLENPILGKKVLKISGMHCEHCLPTYYTGRRIEAFCRFRKKSLRDIYGKFIFNGTQLYTLLYQALRITK